MAAPGRKKSVRVADNVDVITYIDPEMLSEEDIELYKLEQGEFEAPRTEVTQEDTDTDLEIDEEELDTMLGRKKKDRSDCRKMYEAACKRFHAVPSSQFINQLKDKKVQVTDMYLEDKEMKAMTIPLLYNTSVTTIDISGNCFGVRGCQHIMEMLKENVFITEVHLTNNSLGSKGARSVCRLLKIQERIKTMNLSGNKFSEYDAPVFAGMLRQNVTLKNLNLSHNEFGEKGGVLIGAALADNASLDSLDLSWNHIRLQGATAISHSLKENDTLKKLNIAWNGFGNEGVKTLGEALEVNSSLLELDISCNRIGMEGLGYLIKGLRSNEGLQVIKLRSNPISSVGAEHLLQVVKDSEQTKVIQVDIEDVPVTYNFGVLLEQLKEIRTNLDVHHDRYVRGTDFLAKDNMGTKEPYLADPLKLIKMYTREKSVNLVDYFVNCEEETEMSLKEDQFRKAIQRASIPINDKQLDELVKDLRKTDDEGLEKGVDLSTLVNEKEYRSKRRRRKVVTPKTPQVDELEDDDEEQNGLSGDEYSEASDPAEEVDIIFADGTKATTENDDDSNSHITDGPKKNSASKVRSSKTPRVAEQEVKGQTPTPSSGDKQSNGKKGVATPAAFSTTEPEQTMVSITENSD